MQFLREIWFILQNTPALYHRYEKQFFFASLFMGLAILANLLKYRFVGNSANREKVLKWISGISLCLSVLVFLLAFVDLAKSRLPFDDLVCTDIGVDAYYYVPQDWHYELVQRQKCNNRTDHSIRNFADIRDGYYQEIPKWDAQFALAPNKDNVKLAALGRSYEERKNYVGGPGTPTTLFAYWQKTEFDPPLAEGSDIDLVYKISARGAPVEVGAFLSDGTVFYRGVDYDTLHYYLTIHAPSGYQIDLREFGVLDSGGHHDSTETDRQERPHVSASGELLEWHITLARKHLRYMMRYRIRPYAW